MEQLPWQSLGFCSFCSSVHRESTASLQTGCSGHLKSVGLCVKPGAGFRSHFGMQEPPGEEGFLSSEAGMRESLGDSRF